MWSSVLGHVHTLLNLAVCCSAEALTGRRSPWCLECWPGRRQEEEGGGGAEGGEDGGGGRKSNEDFRNMLLKKT